MIKGDERREIVGRNVDSVHVGNATQERAWVLEKFAALTTFPLKLVRSYETNM
jgi:hypothetical protein